MTTPSFCARCSDRGAIPAGEFEEFEHLRAQTGRSQSDLVREAIHLPLAKHKLAS